jgi:hypothetical protein
MTKVKTRLLFLCACTVPFIGVSCSFDSLSQGGTDVANPIVTGRIVTEEGRPAAHTQIMLLPFDYKPVLENGPTGFPCDTTDETGAYTVRAPSQGIYNVEAVQETDRTRCLIAAIDLADRTVRAPAGILHRSGAIRVPLPSDCDAENGYFFIPGTTLAARFALAKGYAEFDSVPAGAVLQVDYSTTTDPRVTRLIRDAVTIAPGSVTSIAFVDWKFSRTLRLNTSSSGANVNAVVTDFPVLVRLTSANFDFAGAKAGGADLLFTKTNGAVLPHEIERWDTLSHTGEIWVRADTVYGDNDTQRIELYFGNDKAAPSPHSNAVFDTAAGFAGVWHLQEGTGDLSDATANALTGKNEGTVAGAGMIGNGRSFSNSRVVIGASSPLSTLSDSITESLWIKSTQRSDSTVSVIRHSGNFTGLQFNASFEWTSYWTDPSTSYSVVGYAPWSGNFGDGTWHYFTVTFKAGRGCFVYMDGNPIASNIADTMHLKTSAGALYLGGTESGNEFFEGLLDEVRIERAFRSPDWIKLCYMNQKSPDALVTVK